MMARRDGRGKKRRDPRPGGGRPERTPGWGRGRPLTPDGKARDFRRVRVRPNVTRPEDPRSGPPGPLEMHYTPAFRPLRSLVLLALAAAGLAAPAAGWGEARGPADSAAGGHACIEIPVDDRPALLAHPGSLLEGAGSTGRAPVPAVGARADRARAGAPAARPSPGRIVAGRHRAYAFRDALARAGRLARPANAPPPFGIV